VYVNEEGIYAPQMLDDHDVIELGKSRFLFISLCGERFEWEDLDDVKKDSKEQESEEEAV